MRKVGRHISSFSLHLHGAHDSIGLGAVTSRIDRPTYLPALHYSDECIGHLSESVNFTGFRGIGWIVSEFFTYIPGSLILIGQDIV